MGIAPLLKGKLSGRIFSVETRIVSVTEKNFDQIPYPVKAGFNCQGCFYWMEKRDGKFDLIKQKKKWFGETLLKYGSLAKMVLWGKRRKPIGYIQFGPIPEFQTAQMFYRDRLPIPKNGWCLTCISLQRSYQKKGLAKKLVLNVLRDLKKRGVKTVDVYELPEFWSKFGFEPVLKEEKGRKIIILRKEL